MGRRSFRPNAEQLAELHNRSFQGVQARNNKYRNKNTAGYDSKKEAKRAGELKFMLSAGLITELQEQPSFVLLPKQEGERSVSYVADFSYKENDKLVVEDVKSEITAKNPAYVIKRKLMLYVHGIKVVEIL